MFSGKSEELLRRLRRSAIAKKRIAVFKPSIDTRWDKPTELCSRNGICFTATPIAHPDEILPQAQGAEVVGIDEAHFFPPGIADVIDTLRKNGVHVILSGLDMDFRGVPFGVVPHLMAIADDVLKLDAVCMVCGDRATMSQRLVSGKPAPAEGDQVLVGDEEYEARCRTCHVV